MIQEKEIDLNLSSTSPSDKPVITGLSDGEVLDRLRSISFSWSFSDPGRGDQTAYRVRRSALCGSRQQLNVRMS